MEFGMTDLIKQRRSIRIFRDEKLPAEDIMNILKAGLLAPSSKNKKPVKFVAAENRDDLDKLRSCKEKGADALHTAACAIAVIADNQKSDVWIEDASVAASYMQLKAEELNIGSVWIQIRKRSNGSSDSETEVRKVLNIPENYGVLCILALGYKIENKKPYEESDIDYSRICFGKYQQ